MTCLTAYSWGIRLNTSRSVPLGFYRLTPVPSPLTTGHLVVIPFPTHVIPWAWRWVPILKHVAAVAGEQVCHQEGHLTIAGVAYGPVHQQVGDHPLPTIPEGCHTVPPGQVFLASQAPRSLDSRYFGSIPITTLTAGATPVLVWEE